MEYAEEKAICIVLCGSGYYRRSIGGSGSKILCSSGHGSIRLYCICGYGDERFFRNLWAILISVIALIAGAVLVYLTYKDDETKKQTEAGTEKETEAAAGTDCESASAIQDGEIEVCSPLAGKIIPLSEVQDEAFSSGALGQGAAIIPTEGKLYAPVDGVVAAFFPTGHAVGIQTEGGLELLIHVGMDTVGLEGRGFDKKVNQGDIIKKGDLLEFDLHIIEEAGLSAVTPVIVTNPAGRTVRRANARGTDPEIVPTQTETVKPGDHFLTIR